MACGSVRMLRDQSPGPESDRVEFRRAVTGFHWHKAAGLSELWHRETQAQGTVTHMGDRPVTWGRRVCGLRQHIGIFKYSSKTWACFLSLALTKLRLCSANHRAGYFSNLACDWLSIVWAYSKPETENGPCNVVTPWNLTQLVMDMIESWVTMTHRTRQVRIRLF